MKFGASVAALRVALEPCARIATSSKIIPILMNVLIEAKGDSVGLASSNLDQTARTSVPAEVASPGMTTVSAGTLLTILRNLPADAACAVEDKDDGNLVLRSGRSRFTLRTLPADDLAPSLVESEFPVTLKFSPGEIVAALGAVSHAISTEETRYYLNGIYLHPCEDRIDVVATDGYRLGMSRLDGEARNAPSVIIPTPAVKEFIRLAGAAKESENVGLSISPTRVRLSLENGTSVTTKVVDGTFPDYQRVIPAQFGRSARLDRPKLIPAIDRVAPLCGSRSVLSLDFSDGRCALSGTSPDAGDASDEIEAQIEEGDFALKCSAEYLRAALSAINGERIKLSFCEPQIVKLSGDGPTIAIVMTMTR